MRNDTFSIKLLRSPGAISHLLVVVIDVWVKSVRYVYLIIASNCDDVYLVDIGILNLDEHRCFDYN